MSLIMALALLGGVLGFAVARPRGLPEAVAAIPAAAVVLVTGLVPVSAAVAEVRELGPTVGFLAAVLLLAWLADRHGVFAWAGAQMAGHSRGRPQRLLAAVFGVAAVTTAALSLDATVVLLTPVVLAAARQIGTRPRPHVYACTHLANSASVLLPVSNLTNLLAFAASGLTFLTFAAVMTAPWLVIIAVEYLVFRLFFATDLRSTTHQAPSPQADTGVAPSSRAATRRATSSQAATGVAPSSRALTRRAISSQAATGEAAGSQAATRRATSSQAATGEAAGSQAATGEAAGSQAATPEAAGPRSSTPEAGAEPDKSPSVTTLRTPIFAVTTLAATLAGFAAAQPFSIDPAWVAVAGAATLAVPLLTARRVRPRDLITAASPAFCAFVLALGVVVLAVRRHGLDTLIAAVAPHHSDLLGLLTVAALAALLSNLVNNLPATLVLLPAVESSPALLLAMLIGVNVGPNLTYAGSLATLLWRRILSERKAPPRAADLLKLGALTVPLAVSAGVAALWAALRLAHI